MIRIREILLTQYIGAIVIGMLIAQALMRVIGLLMEPVIWYQQARSSGSVLDSNSSSFPFSRMLSPTLTVILYVVASYLLLAWLYGAETTAGADSEAAEHAETQG